MEDNDRLKALREAKVIGKLISKFININIQLLDVK